MTFCRSNRLSVLRILRSVAVFAGTLALLPHAGLAAETAERHIQGFNSSGSVFVFEQFGRQDGSGFPYSQIFHISTSTGGAVFGPVRRIVQNESATVGRARRQAQRAARSFNGFLDMGTHAFHHALNETPNAVTTARFSELFGTTVGNAGRNYEVTLTQQVSPLASCTDFTAGTEKSFEVKLKNLGSNAEVTLSAAGFPAGFYNYTCPTEYSISDVVLFKPERSPDTRIVVLVSTYKVGFEGPDRVFVAVTGTLH